MSLEGVCFSRGPFLGSTFQFAGESKQIDNMIQHIDAFLFKPSISSHPKGHCPAVAPDPKRYLKVKSPEIGKTRYTKHQTKTR